MKLSISSRNGATISEICCCCITFNANKTPYEAPPRLITSLLLVPSLKIIESQNHNQKTFNQNEYYQTIAIAMALTIIIIFINNQLNQSITITKQIFANCIISLRGSKRFLLNKTNTKQLQSLTVIIKNKKHLHSEQQVELSHATQETKEI